MQSCKILPYRTREGDFKKVLDCETNKHFFVYVGSEEQVFIPKKILGEPLTSYKIGRAHV